MTDTYYASVRESTAGANKRHRSVFNASGSGKTIVVYRIVAAGTPTAVVAGQTIPLAAIRTLAAPTDGTTLVRRSSRRPSPATLMFQPG